jgi:hypothetical protein
VILKWLQTLTRTLLPVQGRSEVLIQQFERERRTLEQAYFASASTSGLPRGLLWKKCDWLPDYVLLQDRATQQPNLLVSVNLHFEAIVGGDMEDVAAVSNVRDACAVFQWQRNSWTTTGRTLFNMNPQEARDRLAASYEPL